MSINENQSRVNKNLNWLQRLFATKFVLLSSAEVGIVLHLYRGKEYFTVTQKQKIWELPDAPQIVSSSLLSLLSESDPGSAVVGFVSEISRS